MRLFGLLFVLFTLSACASPVITAASFALDGASYLTTKKSMTDHLLSAISNKDCSMIRAFSGNDICEENALEEYLDKGDQAGLTPNGHSVAKLSCLSTEEWKSAVAKVFTIENTALRHQALDSLPKECRSASATAAQNQPL